MGNSLVTYLREPYPYIYGNKRQLLIILGVISLLAFVFSYAFEPFEVNTTEHKIGYVWILVLHATLPIPIVFLYFTIVNATIKDDSRWTIGKEMLHLSIALILIGVGSFLVRDIIYDNPNNWSFRYLYEEVRNSFMVGVLLLLIILPLNLQRLIQKHSKSLEKLSFSKPENIIKKSRICQISGSDFQFHIQDFLFAKVESNYTEIFLEQHDKVVKTLVRITLKDLENQLQNFSNIYKTHRSYLVNLDKIIECKGNAQGYQLTLQKYTDTVPVSRSKLNDFNTYFSATKKST
ncbi:LytTR family transcriptional regulator [Kordia sp. TARA_039_SRF]|nr:LytTR family transcriptional regulator [Kordia sp. TARA_039_SRF]